MLEVTALEAGYGRRRVLLDVDLTVGTGEVVAVFGHNGAGKSTTLAAVSGMVKPWNGRITYLGEDVTSAPCASRVERGMAFIPAEDFVFADLTVFDNLLLGATLERSRSVIQERIELVYELFPILGQRRSQLAGTMSGGEQRMLSLGLALMSGPRLLLLDEPSLGLSPKLVELVMESVRRLVSEQGLSVLLVEQNVMRTLPILDRAYFMRSGQMLLEEGAEALRERDSYWELF